MAAARRPIHQYPEAALTAALTAVQDGMSVREASRLYNVPRSTIQDRISGRIKVGPRKMGPPTVLSTDEELKLANWLKELAKAGFPQKKTDLINTVQRIVQDGKRSTPFTKDGRPGEKWYAGFVRRHPDLVLREPEGLTKSRAIITEELIRKWFQELDQYINENNFQDVFSDPRRVLNGDETSFAMCPKTGKVIAPKGWKNVYDLKKGNEKESITVLLVFSAAGETVHPMVVFPYTRPPASVVKSMPEEWFLGKSETGWMRSEVFYEYIVNGVDKWLKDNHTPKPVILFIDGHKSHLTWHLSKWCHDNGIILYALPPNCTHIMQPADVSVFKPLKSHWKKTIREWHSKADNVNTVLNKNTFCPLLKQCLTAPSLPEAIINGFVRCGLFPLDVNAVDYSKCIQNRLEKVVRLEANVTTSVTFQEMETTKKVLNIYKEKLLNYGIESEQVSAALEELHRTAENGNIANGSPNVVDIDNEVSEVAQDIQPGIYEIQNGELLFIEPCDTTIEDTNNNVDIEVADFDIEASNFSNNEECLTDITEQENLLVVTELEQSASLLEPENTECVSLIDRTKENLGESKENKDSTKDNEKETEEKDEIREIGNKVKGAEDSSTEDNRNEPGGEDETQGNGEENKHARENNESETEEKDETKENRNKVKEAEDASTEDNRNEPGGEDENMIKENEAKENKYAAKVNENETGKKDETKENRNEAKAIEDAIKDNKNEPGGKDEIKKNRNEVNATKDNEKETGEKDETKKNGNKLKIIEVTSANDNKNKTGEKDETKENRNETKAIKDAIKDNKKEPAGEDEAKKNKNEANATKDNDNGDGKKDENKENRNEAKGIKDATKVTVIKKDTNNLADLTSKSFEDHLFWPGPLESQKRNKREKLPSAVSSLAYRRYLEEKELQKKKEEEKREKRKEERKQKANEKKTALEEKTRTKKSRKDYIGKQDNKKTNKKNVDDKEVAKDDTKKVVKEKTEQIKCSACDDELISDVEEDDLKNLGCDNCERWFHLMCTEFVGLPYLEVQNRDFSCFYCS